MRLGILQTDAVRDDLQSEFGDYPGMFRGVLSQGAETEPLEFSNYNVRHEEYPERLEDCDGYLITGSRDSVYDETPWIRTLGEFVRKLDTMRTPLIGICFGHQLIAHVLDGETAPADVGWAVGVHSSEVLAPQPWMTPCQASFRLISSHKDQVVTLPSRAVLFAASEVCPIGGYTIDEHILTFQGHPEFEPEYAAQLMTGRRDLLGEPLFAAGMASLAQRIDSVLIAKWIVNFIHAGKRVAGKTEGDGTRVASA
jgi:GMP synthase-like glutamine amidotransferase